MGQTPSPNKKVRNATPTLFDGINFRSKLEAYTYELLTKNNIHNNYEQYSYTLIPTFIYNDEKIRPITYKPDFVGTNWILECKGFRNETFPVRWKLLKWWLSLNNFDTRLYLVHNKKEVQEAINDILEHERLLQH